MDYQEQMQGRSNYDPSRAYSRPQRQGGIGGVFAVIAILIAALGLVIWFAGSTATSDGAAPTEAAPAADAVAPATDAPAAPAQPAN
ncbi:MAG: hypothetical protein R3E44_00050 [Paracoccaceae bacterium]